MANHHGFRCPLCHRNDELCIQAPRWLRLTPADPIDDDMNAPEWTPENPARCTSPGCD